MRVYERIKELHQISTREGVSTRIQLQHRQVKHPNNLCIIIQFSPLACETFVAAFNRVPPPEKAPGGDGAFFLSLSTPPLTTVKPSNQNPLPATRETTVSKKPAVRPSVVYGGATVWRAQGILSLILSVATHNTV